MTESKRTQDKITFLKERGWSTWYNEDYWVNPKVIEDPKSQDYTNYGLSLEDAYAWETEEGSKKFQPGWGLPALSIAHEMRTRKND